MTNRLIKLQKQRQTRTAEIDKLNGTLAALMADRDRLETDINNAIDSGDTGLAKKLVSQHRDIEEDIEVTQRTLDRKSVQNADLPELVAACSADMAEYQKKIDQAQAEALKARKAYLSKLLDVAVLVNEAWATRADYCSMKDGAESPLTHNASNREFDGVTARIEWNRQRDGDLLLELNPDAIGIITAAAKDHHDNYAGRDFTPRNPGVIISKY